jgi:tRNA 2-thiouridine synthesizing protein A
MKASGKGSGERIMAEDEARVLDAKGLLCPLPVLKARKVLKEVPAGGVLRVLATDPGAPKDFVAFCRTTGNALLSSTEEAGVFIVEIQKSGP